MNEPFQPIPASELEVLMRQIAQPATKRRGPHAGKRLDASHVTDLARLAVRPVRSGEVVMGKQVGWERARERGPRSGRKCATCRDRLRKGQRYCVTCQRMKTRDSLKAEGRIQPVPEESDS